MSSGTAPVDATCYRPLTNGTIQSFNDSFYLVKDSGSYSYCCFDSAEYLADGICYQSDHATNSTGYYVALCTDPTYKDPSCSQDCVSYAKGDIVYSNNEWLCCGADASGNNPTCNTPTSEVVPNIPSPNQLQAIATATTTTTTFASTPTSTFTSSTSSSSTSSPTSSLSNPSIVAHSTASSGLSTGAKAGIGAGIGIVALAAIILFAFFYMRRSRQAHQSRDRLSETSQLTKGFASGHSPHGSIPPAYADTGYRPQPKPPVPSELGSRPVRLAPAELGDSAVHGQAHLVEMG